MRCCLSFIERGNVYAAVIHPHGTFYRFRYPPHDPRQSLQYGAINLSQGLPGLRPAVWRSLDRLAEVAHEDFHQYSITWGAQNFREALAEKQSRLMGRQIDPNTEIVTTCGSTEAMMAAMMTVANPGDKVIVFSPFYENYGADTILSGAEPIYVPLHPPAVQL